MSVICHLCILKVSYTTFYMKITILKSVEEFDQYIANYLYNIFKSAPITVALPTGSTPINAYVILAEMYKSRPFHSQAIKIFNLDEYYPIKKTSPYSYYTFMKTYIIDPLQIPIKNWNIPNSELDSSDQASIQYNKLLETSPLDISVLGIGPKLTCHIGFNEKGSERESITRYVELDQDTKKVNRKFFEGNCMPTGAITMGIKNILSSKKILLIAKGKDKAEGIKRSVNGIVNSDAPASFLQEHSDVEIILDADSASLLG